MDNGYLFDLADRTVVITGAGANGGVGHGLAIAFAKNGADVVVSDIDFGGAVTTGREVESYGRKALVVRCDISKPEDVQNLFLETDKFNSKIDILINVPYAFPERVQPHELSLDSWEKTLSISLTGYFLCCKQAIQRMLMQESGGCILNIGCISSVSALGRGNFAYSTAKAGVGMLTKELAVEYAGRGIRVNAILPAQIQKTGPQRAISSDPRFGEKLRERFLDGIPMNRLLDVEDLYGPAIFLCSDAARAVTGVLLPVDGGNLALNAGGSHTWPIDF